jgi:hypothetical protein
VDFLPSFLLEQHMVVPIDSVFPRELRRDGVFPSPEQKNQAGAVREIREKI